MKGIVLGERKMKSEGDKERVLLMLLMMTMMVLVVVVVVCKMCNHDFLPAVSSLFWFFLE